MITLAFYRDITRYQLLGKYIYLYIFIKERDKKREEGSNDLKSVESGLRPELGGGKFPPCLNHGPRGGLQVWRVVAGVYGPSLNSRCDKLTEEGGQGKGKKKRRRVRLPS